MDASQGGAGNNLSRTNTRLWTGAGAMDVPTGGRMDCGGATSTDAGDINRRPTQVLGWVVAAAIIALNAVLLATYVVH
ncbi:MAG: hypothetical protein PVSMB4_04800 [Ktedonobacterales bacterium]